MNVVVNGNAQVFKDGGTVGELLGTQGIVPERVAVVVNGSIVKKDVRDVTPLREGDRIEILTFMGGG